MSRSSHSETEVSSEQEDRRGGSTYNRVPPKDPDGSPHSETPPFPLQLPGPYPPHHPITARNADILLSLVPVAFIVFASLALAYDGKPVTPDSRTHTILSVSAYGPTIFPVMFAAIGGRAIRAIATWRLEAGTTIGRVEQLTGSQTIFGALFTTFQLRILDIPALTILIFWAVSLVGSQASLRVVTLVSSQTRHTEPITVLDPQTPMWHALTASDWATDIFQAMFSNGLLSALSPDVMEKTQDSYENVKVPMLETLEGYEDGGWITLSDTSNTSVTYAGLIGLPFGPKPSSENTSFTLSTSYLSLDYPVFRIDPGQCDDLYKENRTLADEFRRTADPLQPSMNNWTFAAGPQSDTDDVTGDIACGSGFLLGVSTCYKGCTPTQASWDARKIAWSSASDIGFAHVECNIRTSYADVDYSCVKGTCQSRRARRSPDPPHDANVTVFDMKLGTMAASMVSHLAHMYPFVDSGASTPVMQYILSPSEALTRYVRQNNVSVIEVGRKQFEIRLGQLINTVYLIGVSPTIMSGGTQIDQADVNPSPELGYDYQFLNTTRVVSTTSSLQDLLRCNKAWFSVLVVASTISLAAAIASIVIRSRTLLPDVLGTLSLATLKTVSTGGSTLDGMERARILKSVGVRMGDMLPAATHGRIALAAPSAGDEIRNLEKWRLYE